MKASSVTDSSDKRGHICPPSNATHPSDRWESLFVYGFLCKFTQLRGKVEGLETPMDFEQALLSPEANPIMTQILSKFILNLRPQTRNLSSDVISSTISTVLQEYFKSNERTVFWNEEIKMNVDPLANLNGGFWNADWDMRLKILRQLVELQLCHSTEIKSTIDRAWGVVHNKHKKAEATSAPPPPADPQSMENLSLNPLGQDSQRKRYWVIDDSPRVYLSTNPWKITATFQTNSSTREEYVAIIDKLKETAPPHSKDGERRTKLEQGHLNLIKTLEERLPAIDAEIARIQRIRRKIEQRHILMAQAEVRETRTRRRTNRPDYAYLNDPDSEDDRDEYQYQDDADYEDRMDDVEFPNLRSNEPSTSRPGRRRSTRSTRANDDGHISGGDEWSEWRGERRSSRLGAPSEMQLDGPPPKRARTEDSAVSTNSGDRESPAVVPAAAPAASGNGLKIKIKGAAAIKPTETAVESIAGKKKSKFWFYAVEPIAGAQPAPVQNPPLPTEPASNGGGTASSAGPSSSSNGYHHGAGSATDDANDVPMSSDGDDLYQRSIEGSLSPTSSMDES